MNNYKKEDLTIGILKAQFIVFLIFIPWIIIFGSPYCLLWGNNFSKDAFNDSLSLFRELKSPVIILIIIVSIIIHELLHGITCAKYAKTGFKSIRFGVAWKFLTPYCHCSEPLTVKQYIAGAEMPCLVLGIIPSIISIFTGIIVLLVFGMFMIFSAGGDFMIINKLRTESKDDLVQDHPSKIGCCIYRPLTI